MDRYAKSERKKSICFSSMSSWALGVLLINHTTSPGVCEFGGLAHLASTKSRNYIVRRKSRYFSGWWPPSLSVSCSPLTRPLHFFRYYKCTSRFLVQLQIQFVLETINKIARTTTPVDFQPSPQFDISMASGRTFRLNSGKLHFQASIVQTCIL